jgi:hypothetical protein
MSSDPGQTHYVGDGCQPAHDPAIDQTPPEERFKLEGGQILLESEEWDALANELERLRVEIEDLTKLGQSYLGEASEEKVRAATAEAEVERLTVELTHRVGWEERCLDAEAALATLRAENARLRAVLDEIAAEDDE